MRIVRSLPGVALLLLCIAPAVRGEERAPATIEQVSTGKKYSFTRAAAGAKTCIDRDFAIKELSDTLRGAWLLQTSNDDDFATAAGHVRLTLTVPASIFVCFDGRSRAAPTWLKEWTLTSEKVVTSDVTSRVYEKTFAAGSVRLGANEREATGALSHYFAIIVPRGDVPPLTTKPAVKVDFAKDIQPLLAKRCFDCHGADTQEAGLRLDVRRRALLGGDTGLAIDPASPHESELLKRITHADEKHRMPPDEKLSDREIELLTAWIDQGAPWPDELAGQEAHSDHWAFQPIRRPVPPAVRDAARARNPIDLFLLAKLEAHDLSFSPEADRAALIRRLHLDLIGLPPAPHDVQAFLIDQRPDAYERLVDRLLASSHFGERWGRHWLDLARFAESDGYENDRVRPHAWRYRDWVIDAVNRDLPFDRFARDQLAGDLLENAAPAERIATGFHRNTLYNSAASADKEEFRIRAAKDRAETTATAFLGLTLACAQCHSHKYDPLAQREYYQFFAFFNATDDDQANVAGGEAMVLKQAQRATHVHRRGDFQQLGPRVHPGTPAFLAELKPRGSNADRLDLAAWIASEENPLTARVAVNRFWQHLFGQGIVASPENFGKSGKPPSHPELLDWLASEFMQSGWSRKQVVRTMVLSSAYRQSSQARPELKTLDPDNRLLARQNRYRVEAEVIRDAALSVSGLLNVELHGPSIVPPFPDGLLSHKLTAEVLKEPGGDRYRRGVYIHVQRTLTHPSLAAFDVADGNAVCVRRERSTTPAQALTLLNDPVFVECTAALGTRLRQWPGERDDKLRAGFRLCLAREPSASEIAVLSRLVQRQQTLGASDEALWHGVARTLLNLDEFVTRE